MGTLQPDSEANGDLDDSGCIEDGSPAKKQAVEMENGYCGGAQLLDLSDDVLLCILKHCAPRDLKALGYTCPRLAALIRDRTLWQAVDARGQASGRARLRWLLGNVLNDSTTELLLTGFAREARGCLGHVNQSSKDLESMEDKRTRSADRTDHTSAGDNDTENAETASDGESSRGTAEPPYPLHRQHARLHINAQQLPRFSGSPSWSEGFTDVSETIQTDTKCRGPQFTLTQKMLRELQAQCPRLTSLSLEYCNINCKKTGLYHLPPTLKKLSLRGTKCYNLPLDKSFLFKIQDYMPDLEYLDVSECEWLEPASLLPLSKMKNLQHLLMRDCFRLTEFVAYASLATRYGFRKLKVLDLRGSPVGDSEVSALGWVPELEELYLSPASEPPEPAEHSHCKGRALPPHDELEPWETLQEPGSQPADYTETILDRSFDDIEESPDCVGQGDHTSEYNYDVTHGSTRIEVTWRPPGGATLAQANLDSTRADNSTKRKTEDGSGDWVDMNDNQPGPSNKRKRSDGNARTPEGADNIEEPRSWSRLQAADTDSECSDKEVENRTRSSDSISEVTDPSSEGIFEVTDPSSESTEKTENIGAISETIESNIQILRELKRKITSEDIMSFKKKRESEVCTKSDNAVDDDLTAAKHQNDVNEGASTSKNVSKAADSEAPSTTVTFRNPLFKSSDSSSPKSGENKPESENSDEEDDNSSTKATNGAGSSQNNSENSSESSENAQVHRFENYVRFRQNLEPVIIQCPVVPRQEEPENQEAEPRHHILYVNVGQQLHAVYRLLPNRPIFHSIRNRNWRPNIRNIFYTPPTLHLDSTSIVTDSAIRRFGRADGEDINYVHIGPNGPYPVGRDVGARPNRSNLRVLSVTGFRNITDRSLVHLATAAPHLRLIDFSRTGVSDQGVENFKNIRPECEVRYSKYEDRSGTTE